MTRPKRGPLLNYLDAIEAKCRQNTISLREVLDIFGTDGHYVLIVFLTIPFLQPIPMPGVSTPFGIVIALVAGLAFLGKSPCLPERLARKQISPRMALAIAQSSERVFEKILPILHPRLNFFFVQPFKPINTFLIAGNAVLLALPLPIPFSNSLPAWAIVFQALAHLERDGLFVLLSYVQCGICAVYFLFISKGLESSISFLSNWVR